MLHNENKLQSVKHRNNSMIIISKEFTFGAGRKRK